MPYLTRQNGIVTAISAVKSATALEFQDDSHPDVREFLNGARRAREAMQLRAEMNAADLRIIRAMVEGDVARIDAHKADQAVRRARLAGLTNPA